MCGGRCFASRPPASRSGKCWIGGPARGVVLDSPWLLIYWPDAAMPEVSQQTTILYRHGVFPTGFGKIKPATGPPMLAWGEGSSLFFFIIFLWFCPSWVLLLSFRDAFFASACGPNTCPGALGRRRSGVHIRARPKIPQPKLAMAVWAMGPRRMFPHVFGCVVPLAGGRCSRISFLFCVLWFVFFCVLFLYSRICILSRVIRYYFVLLDLFSYSGICILSQLLRAILHSHILCVLCILCSMYSLFYVFFVMCILCYVYSLLCVFFVMCFLFHVFFVLCILCYVYSLLCVFFVMCFLFHVFFVPCVLYSTCSLFHVF
ncbi:hypothetical protein METBIDRAFT_178732 [Metschnikowia bicuspidata var. bicuspidata NRRL YB-4993]|uniref:Uncharacterized protein n=1 Tax=Metschnikowia bicuspidata var. bicuspidata NRRL YB-4993 TaxID=869754 RepID=A0A1A0HBK9_9ASCO|nr:hypothetical protein METBIDRAFT_178732 [Metschnikowia bicuspidata var. bicuspidata NRRL YB-4993]OBA21262.1 hypothetical protein METBIDRAFT_178732 [Metschnikowia bicuspidata var. bicuspidata NRRL YB-4993]